MPVLVYPSDVAPAAAADVLAALNAAVGAGELADAIGFSEGVQVGRQLSTALLAARPDGGFGDLAAVLAVPRISTARFTEIVAALSSTRPTVAGAGLRLELRARRGELWLGQGTSLVARLLDSAGRGVEGRPVTLTASLGALSGTDGRRLQTGSALVVTTGRSGLVEFSYGPGVSPPLTLAEREALEAALARLPLESRRVVEAAEELEQLVALYRGGSGSDFRRAVDRLYAAMPAARVDPAQLWPTRSATIIALVGNSDASAGAAELVTSRTLIVRDWLGAWYTALEGAISGDRRAEPVLDAISRDREVDRLTRNVVAVTQAFGSLEFGELGARLRDRATSVRLNRYLAASVDSIGGEALTSLVRDTGNAAEAIRAGGLTAFKVADASAKVTRPKFDAGDLGLELERFGGRLAEVERTGIDRAALEGLRSEIERSVGSMAARLGNLEETTVDRSTLDARFAAFEAGTDLGSVTGRLDALEERQVVEADLAALGHRIDEVEAAQVRREDLVALRDDLAARPTLADVDARISEAAVDAERLDAIGGRLEALEAPGIDRGALDAIAGQLRSEFDERVSGVATRVDDLAAGRITRDDINALEERVEALSSEKIDRADLDVRLGEITTVAPAELVSLESRVDAAIKVATDALRSDLGTMVERTVEELDVAGIARRTDALGERLGQIESERVGRADLDQLTDRIDAALAEARSSIREELTGEMMRTFEARAAADLEVLDARLSALTQRLREDAAARAKLAERLDGLEASTAEAGRLSSRVTDIEEVVVKRGDFDALRTEVLDAARAVVAERPNDIVRLERTVSEMDARLAQLQAGATDEEALRAEIRAAVLEDVRGETRELITQNQRDVERMLETKANTSDVARLEQRQKLTDSRLGNITRPPDRPLR